MALVKLANLKGPQGPQGPKGDTGAQGPKGDAGTAAVISSATATTLPAGSAATVTAGGTSSARTFAFGIPKGDKGDKGDTGAQGPKGDKGDPGTGADIGAATTAAAGIIELATQAEVNAGTDAVRAVTPSTLAAWGLQLRPYNRAVFIGASNVVPGTWPEKLSTLEGWTAHNFATGGVDIVSGGFMSQLDAAIASTAFTNSQVGYVFVAGGGNDIRSNHTAAQVTTAMQSLLSKAKTNFPNARIIVVPALWNNGGLHQNTMTVAGAMQDVALANHCEVVWHAWEWLIGLDGTYMADALHPTAEGYDVFVSYLRRYLRGHGTAVNYGSGATLQSGYTLHERGYLRCVCIDGIVHFQARVRKAGGDLAWNDQPILLPTWAAASIDSYPRPLLASLGSAESPGALFAFADTRLVSLRSGTSFSNNELNIPPQSWPIGA